MPDRDPTLDVLRELRDVGVTPPRAPDLHARVSSAITEEIEREQHLRRGGLNGGSPGRSTGERLGGARRRLGFARLAGGLVPVVGVLVVVLVVAVFSALRGSGPSSTAPNHGSVGSSHGSVELVYLAEPSVLAPVVTRVALERTVDVMRERLRALGIGGRTCRCPAQTRSRSSCPTAETQRRRSARSAPPPSWRFMTGRRTP